ncbi:MAG: hypothetical protein ACUVV1_07565 [Fimbriimonadales bacterium]
MDPLLQSLRGAAPDARENYRHLGSGSGEPTEQRCEARHQFRACPKPEACHIGDVQHFQPSPDQMPLGKQSAPALEFCEVELRGAAHDMQARLEIPPDSGRDARAPVPHQRGGGKLYLHAREQQKIGIQYRRA